jgi:hypothetical protein
MSVQGEGNMIEIRLHGRGGQGAVTSAELLALAAIHEGKYAQAFPSFGPERRGAPVVAFCRIDMNLFVFGPTFVILTWSWFWIHQSCDW